MWNRYRWFPRPRRSLWIAQFCYILFIRSDTSSFVVYYSPIVTTKKSVFRWCFCFIGWLLNRFFCSIHHHLSIVDYFDTFDGLNNRQRYRCRFCRSSLSCFFGFSVVSPVSAGDVLGIVLDPNIFLWGKGISYQFVLKPTGMSRKRCVKNHLPEGFFLPEGGLACRH